MTDTIIANSEICELPGRGPVNLLDFHTGAVVMVSAVAVGLYRDRAALEDPLGNGTLGYEAIPEPLQPPWVPELGHVREQLAGFVGLTSGAVLFIRPDGIGLYPDNEAALRNRDCQWLLEFENAPKGAGLNG